MKINFLDSIFYCQCLFECSMIVLLNVFKLPASMTTIVIPLSLLFYHNSSPIMVTHINLQYPLTCSRNYQGWRILSNLLELLNYYCFSPLTMEKNFSSGVLTMSSYIGLLWDKIPDIIYNSQEFLNLFDCEKFIRKI